MGTTTGIIQQGETVRAYIVRSEGFDRDGWKVIAHNSRGREHYFALLNPRTGNTEGLVVLAGRSGRSVSVKVIHEDMGPYYYGAGPRVLEALSPTAAPMSITWRDQCEIENKRRSALKGAGVGSTLEIGASRYRLVGKIGGQWVGRHEGSGLDYRIGRSAWSRAAIV
jgi:hypothetical protein